MTLVSYLGALIGLAALPFASHRMTLGRLLLALSLMLVHIAASVVYFLYVQRYPADTTIYYFDQIHIAQHSFALGTIFTAKFVQFLKGSLGASYLDCFVLFQAVGFWGVIFLMRTFEEIQVMANSGSAIWPNYLLFLPSLHFWTSAIGKDAPLFFAVSICTWSSIHLSRRFIPLSVAILTMVLFRPHVALLAVASLAAAAFFHREMRPASKILLLGIAIGALGVLAGTVHNTLGVDVSSADSVSDFLRERSNITEMAKGGTAVISASFFARLASLLFRPFFFDASGLFGIIASVENVGSILLFISLLKNQRYFRFALKNSFSVKFMAMFSFLLIMMLTIVYYNVGLGIRQRVMVFPTLLSIFVAVRALRAYHAQAVLRENPDFLLNAGAENKIVTASRG